jgi:hypothetical protein
MRDFVRWCSVMGRDATVIGAQGQLGDGLEYEPWNEWLL